MSYQQRLTDWVRNHYRLTTVPTEVRIEPWGADMNGSTEGGFYESFEVNLSFQVEGKLVDYETVRGSDLESLWRAVVVEDE